MLHVAQYYGVPRLTHLCEVKLGRVLKGATKGGGGKGKGAEGAGCRGCGGCGGRSLPAQEAEEEDDGEAATTLWRGRVWRGGAGSMPCSWGAAGRGWHEQASKPARLWAGKQGRLS